MHAPPQKNKGTGCASGHNWPQSNQPQLPSTVIGFRAINKAAIIKFEQAPACPWHCLSLQFIHRVSYSFGCDEWMRTAVINSVIHPMLCVVYSCRTSVTQAAAGVVERWRSGRENVKVFAHIRKYVVVKCWQKKMLEGLQIWATKRGKHIVNSLTL